MEPKTLSQIPKKAQVPFWNIWKGRGENITVSSNTTKDENR
jgi:hypothetical protein